MEIAHRWRWAHGLGLVGIALACAGCGDATVGRVHGTVLLDDAPLNDAIVEFYSQEDGSSSAGRTDAQGRYELWMGRCMVGTKVGEYRVQISTMVGESPAQTPERVPAKYNLRTELQATVRPGSNTFDFQLDSSGDIIQPI